MLLSSQRDNYFVLMLYSSAENCGGVFSFTPLRVLRAPLLRSQLKTLPRSVFLTLRQVLKEIITLFLSYTPLQKTAEEFFFYTTSGPQSSALAVAAKNTPPECFLNATTGSQRDNQILLVLCSRAENCLGVFCLAY